MGHTGHSFPNIDMGQTFTFGASVDGFRVHRDSAYSWAGSALSLTGDVNGDSYDDLVIGAPGSNSQAGIVYVLFGRVTGVGFTTIDLNGFVSGPSTGFKITGPSPTSWFGSAVHSAGDFNNDGIADLLLAASKANFDFNDEAGIVYLIFGSASLGADMTTSSFSSGASGFMIGGKATGDRFGSSVKFWSSREMSMETVSMI